MGADRSLQIIEASRAGANVDAAALSLAGMPMASSDPVSGELEGWQFVCGEGPSLDAYALNTTAGCPDTSLAHGRWTGLGHAVGSWPFRAVFAFPVTHGSATLGALTLYRMDPGPLTSWESAVADNWAAEAARWLGESLLDESHPAVGYDQFDLLHRAVGVLMGQTGVSADTATATIRARALDTHRDLARVVADILDFRSF